MKPKLLVTASTFPRSLQDTEPRFVLDLCKELLTYFDVTVLVPHGINTKEHEIIEGVKIIRYHYFPIHRWETLCYPGAIIPRIKEQKRRALLVPFLFLGLWYKLFKILPHYDVVHAHWIIPQGLVQSLFKKPYIVTGHGGDIMSLNTGLLKLFKKYTLQRAQHVTVVSEALKHEIDKMVPENKLSVISMGCDTKKFSPSLRINNYFNQNTCKIILFVGRLVEIKGVNYLIDAMCFLNAKLLIVGTGPQEVLLKRKVKELQLDEKVLFLGPKNHNELPTIFASSDIFCVPSITDTNGAQEGKPTVLFEAMASGLPIVATRTGGIPEVVEDSYDGFLVSEKDSDALAEKLGILINNPQLYNDFSQNVLMHSREWDYSTIAQKFADILLRLYKGD